MVEITTRRYSLVEGEERLRIARKGVGPSHQEGEDAAQHEGADHTQQDAAVASASSIVLQLTKMSTTCRAMAGTDGNRNGGKK
jgi:hypothetical protein